MDVFDRLGFFRVFSAPWFVLLLTVLMVSIVCCTLDRTPRLWRGVRHVHVEQPEAFFDLRLSERALLEHAQLAPDDMAGIFRRRHFRVRRATSATTDETWVYGDRNQYFKLATLLTHLGLILFLVGGAVTAAFGFETVLFVGDGQTAPVQPVGTPHNLLVKNVSFSAPQRADGSFTDYSTDLAVYQDGQQIARKTIRVNDPLEVDGYVFHQNTFGPSADVDIRDPAGPLVWTGPVLLARHLRRPPAGLQTIPGSDIGLQLVLDRANDGSAVLALDGIGPADADRASAGLFLAGLAIGGSSDPAATAGYTITWTEAGAWTGIVVKNDPGQTIIWLAFLFLI